MEPSDYIRDAIVDIRIIAPALDSSKEVWEFWKKYQHEVLVILNKLSKNL